MASTLSNIIDSQFNSIREFDTNGSELTINPDNMNIAMACLKNFYKLKIDLLLGFETSVRSKIDKLNKLIPEINNKLKLIKMDGINKDRICADIVSMIIDCMEKINLELIPTIAPSNITEVLKLYNQVREVELQLLNMCDNMKRSFTGPYEHIIHEKINDKLKQADNMIASICTNEKYDPTLPILNSYLDFSSCVRSILDFIAEIKITSVQELVSKRIALFHEIYLPVISKFDETTSLGVLFVLYNTMLKLKENIITLNIEPTTATIIINKYCDTEKLLKTKICNTYSRPINLQITENVTKIAIKSDCTIKICGILNKIDHPVVDKKTIELIWNAVINNMISTIISSFVALDSHIFEPDFTEAAKILIGELSSFVKKTIKERFEIITDPSKYTNELFKRADLVINYALCDKLVEGGFKNDFAGIYGNLKLYDNLCKLKESAQKLHGGKRSSSKFFQPSSFNPFHKRTDSDGKK